jgi:hypothetical protein
MRIGDFCVEVISAIVDNVGDDDVLTYVKMNVVEAAIGDCLLCRMDRIYLGKPPRQSLTSKRRELNLTISTTTWQTRSAPNGVV